MNAPRPASAASAQISQKRRRKEQPAEGALDRAVEAVDIIELPGFARQRAHDAAAPALGGARLHRGRQVLIYANRLVGQEAFGAQRHHQIADRQQLLELEKRLGGE